MAVQRACIRRCPWPAAILAAHVDFLKTSPYDAAHLEAPTRTTGVADDDVLTVKNVAEYLKLTERTVYRLVQEGELPGFKVGNSWRFLRRDLQRWIAQQTRQARKPKGA